MRVSFGHNTWVTTMRSIIQAPYIKSENLLQGNKKGRRSLSTALTEGSKVFDGHKLVWLLSNVSMDLCL